MAISIGTTTPSTGILTATGVGSGLDVDTLVTSLVNAKKDAPQKQITNQQTATQTQLSALGVVGSSLSALQSALASLGDGSAFAGRKVSSADSAVFTGSAGAASVPGSYTIEVSRLASAQKVSSAAIADASNVGTGTLTIAVGDKQMHLDIDAAHASLAAIRDAINNASDNPGVTATIVNGTDGAHLVMSGASAGASNGFTVSSTGDGGLAALDFGPDVPAGSGAQQIVAAQDAAFTIDGMAATSAGNTVTDAIDGITLNLGKVGTSTLTVANDSGAATSAVTNLVNTYNSFVGIYKNLTRYDATANTAGALIGDATLNSIRSTLAAVVGGIGGDGTTLSSIGLNLQTDGTIKIDNDALAAATADGGSRLKAMFGGDAGFATKLAAPIDGWNGATGILATRTSNLNKQLSDLTNRQAQLNSRMDTLTARYRAQFTALDTLMSKLSNTSSYLTQQFDALNNINKK
ncbi:MAG: flagellar filament capping protein FliD [Rhodanobacter sp.]